MNLLLSDTNETYAAVDLGSNSFHMIVANVVDGRAIIVDRIKEMVRLAGGLDDKNRLTDEAIEAALQCLEKFGQRIKTIPASNIRAVGTNTLRQARNGVEFLSQANVALGHKIEIISGREEA
ncbi:MAG: exopolyphosphatase/guanosine-5'-triphosphate,3'-diphosphate pyrophosphatase, partial [Gammaproteobacteria bacterium]